VEHGSSFHEVYDPAGRTTMFTAAAPALVS
jgi:hypothetical protein